MSLIEEIQNKGLSDEMMIRAWKNIGAPRSPEALYDFLTNVLKDKQKVADAFGAIGLKFQDVGDEAGAADVIGKGNAKRLYKELIKLSPDLIRQLIQIVQSGKLPS